MTNEEKAREIAHDYFRRGQLGLVAIDTESAGYDCAIQAMKWKDKERKELWRITRNHYQEWAEEQIAKEKQKLNEKVCEWIKNNACYFAHWEWNGDTYEKEVVFDAECCIEAFKESIKGE